MTRPLILASTAALIAAAGLATAGLTQVAPRPAPPAAGTAMQARPAAPPARARPGNPLLVATQALFDGYVRDGKMPGIVAAFGIGDAPTQFVSAGRIADGPTAAVADPDSLWRIYSMTKPVTAMAAMALIEDGRLRLDQPLADIYPEYRGIGVLTAPDTSLDARPARTPITIRHLLTHTSGLGYSISAKGPLLAEYERLGILPGQVNGAVEAAGRARRPASLQEFARRTARVPLVYEPGTRWHYSIGLDVLAAVVEKVSGQRFEDFLQARFFGPLDMRSTVWTVPAGDVARFSTNYAWMGDRRIALDPAATSVFLRAPSFPYGGAGLVSSARDYDRFLHMLANGGELGGRRVLKAETVRLAMSNLLPANVVFRGVDGSTGGASAGGPAQGFGAGGSVYLQDMNGVSKGTYGWGGAAGTTAFVDPVRRLRGTVMVQYFPADKWPVRQQTVVALAQDAARLHPR